MLQIIWLILKIILLVILILLGLILTILLIVLFVPVRYKIKAAYSDDLQFYSTGSWLFHIIHVSARMNDNIKHLRLRLFGKTIYDSLWSESKKNKGLLSRIRKKPDDNDEFSENNNKKRKNKKHKRNASNKVKVKESNKRNNENIDTNIDSNSTINSTAKNSEQKDDVNLSGQNIVQDNDNGSDINSTAQNSENLSGQNIVQDNDPDIIEQGKKHNSDTITDEVEDIKGNEVDNSNEYEDNSGSKKGPFEFIKKIISHIKALISKVTNAIKNIKEKLFNLIKLLANVKRKIQLINKFIKDEVNKEGFSVVFVSAKKLIKHILPKKFRANVVFGTGDPCSTGQALGVGSLLYGLYGDNIRITPDFENKVIKGDLYARGRIRIVTILIIVIKLIIDKRFKRLKRNVNTLKEAL